MCVFVCVCVLVCVYVHARLCPYLCGVSAVLQTLDPGLHHTHTHTHTHTHKPVSDCGVSAVPQSLDLGLLLHQSEPRVVRM